METTYADSWSDMGQACDIDCEGQHDLHITVQW